MTFCQFLGDESGAIAVDWTVLTGALVGLGIATAGLVSTGVESTAGATSDDIASVQFASRFRPGFRWDFSAGIGGWSGGTPTDVPGFGEALLIEAGEMVQATFNIDGEGAAVLEFDMLYLDTWDNESATVWVNGQAAAIGTLIHTNHESYGNGNSPVDFSSMNLEGVTVELIESPAAIDGGFQGNALDHRQRVRITVDDPGQSVDLGFTTNLDQDVFDESFAVDDITVSQAR